jgi:hypothetical protein
VTGTLAPSQPSVQVTSPYLTVAEFQNAPTGVDLKGLVPGATNAQRDAELSNVILRASGIVNQIAGQNLAATTDIEQRRVRLNRSGEIFCQTECWPILAVNFLKVGGTPSAMSAVALTDLYIEHSSFTVAQPSLNISTSSGPLQFASISPTGQAYAQWSYENGWPVTRVTNSPAGGATSVIVADATGIHLGTKLTIYDADKTETVTVTVEPTTTTITVTALANAHTGPVMITSLPPAVKEAAILVTAALIKTRGSQALVMDSISQTKPKKQPFSGGEQSDIEMARWILEPFRAVR